MNSTKNKTTKVGVMSLEDFKKRTIAIARGEYKPKKDEPKIWFNSIKSLKKFFLKRTKNYLI